MKWLDVLKNLAVLIAALREIVESLEKENHPKAASLSSCLQRAETAAQSLEAAVHSEPSSDESRVRYSPE